MKARKLVCGVGVNDADYAVQKWEEIGYINGKRKRKLVWACPYYVVWTSMLKRCYSTKFQKRYSTYIGCTVAKEWHTFSNFKAWMENHDFEGKHLDKDLLFEGNKLYSAETCAFVTPLINTFANDHEAKRGEWLIGVCWHKSTGKFLSQCRNPLSGEREHLGLFTSEQQAHEAWLRRKLELAHGLAAIQTDPRIAKALINRYLNYMN